MQLRIALKGFEEMDQLMLADIWQKLTEIFDQVSAPLYHNGEGPFFMATREQGDDMKFFFYEVNDVETFLATLEKVPAAFSAANFLFNSTDDMVLTAIEYTNQFYDLYLMRLVPDLPVCRLALQHLQAKNPNLLLNIALLDEEGKIIPAVTALNSSVWLS